MTTRRKPRPRKDASVRQSVTLQARLATEVQRVAKEHHLTRSRALVLLAERGVEAKAAARKNLAASYRQFMAEADPRRKEDAGKNLIRAIFGKDALAEDPV